MRAMLTILSAVLAMAGGAAAGEIYVTRDAKGNAVYTDTPQSIPAEKLKVRSASTDPAEVQARYAEQMERIGWESCVMCTDFGVYTLPTPVEGLREFIACLMDMGIPDEDISTMVKRNPEKLLGLT